MKRIIKLICLVFCVLLPFPSYLDINAQINFRGQYELLPNGAVMATIVEPAIVYTDCYEKSGRICRFETGEIVEIIQDRSLKWYLVRDAYGNQGWVKAEYLEIPPDEPPLPDNIPANLWEELLNSSGFESRSEYFVLVDISRQRTMVFTGRAGEWTMLCSLVCATGRNESPTRRGMFLISKRGEWFYSPRHNSGAKYWVRFHDAFLFHSLAMDARGEILDNVLGEKRSSGCVRLSVEDAKWFYENIPEGTAVFIR